jgi:serine/threonine protein kinase
VLTLWHLQQTTALISVIKPIAWNYQTYSDHYHVSTDEPSRGQHKVSKEFVYFELRYYKIARKTLLAGYEVLQSLPPHPNIAGLREAFMYSANATVAFVRTIGPSYHTLDTIIAVNGPFRSGDRTLEDVCRSLLRQMLTALSFLHSRNYIFGNVNLDGCVACLMPPHLLLWDFSATCPVGTLGPKKVALWTSATPEQLTQGRVPAATSQDMWGVGQVAYMLNAGYPPFGSRAALQDASFRFEGSAWYNANSDCKDFIRRLLVVSPANRYTTGQCLTHRWLAS